MVCGCSQGSPPRSHLNVLNISSTENRTVTVKYPLQSGSTACSLNHLRTGRAGCRAAGEGKPAQGTPQGRRIAGPSGRLGAVVFHLSFAPSQQNIEVCGGGGSIAAAIRTQG